MASARLAHIPIRGQQHQSAAIFASWTLARGSFERLDVVAGALRTSCAAVKVRPALLASMVQAGDGQGRGSLMVRFGRGRCTRSPHLGIGADRVGLFGRGNRAPRSMAVLPASREPGPPGWGELGSDLADRRRRADSAVRDAGAVVADRGVANPTGTTSAGATRGAAELHTDVRNGSFWVILRWAISLANWSEVMRPLSPGPG